MFLRELCGSVRYPALPDALDGSFGTMITLQVVVVLRPVVVNYKDACKKDGAFEVPASLISMNTMHVGSLTDPQSTQRCFSVSFVAL